MIAFDDKTFAYEMIFTDLRCFSLFFRFSPFSITIRGISTKHSKINYVLTDSTHNGNQLNLII